MNAPELEVVELDDLKTRRYFIDIDHRSLRMAYGQDIIRGALDSLSRHVEQEMFHRLMSGNFDKLIQDAIELAVKEEVKKQVAKVVAARIDDFIEEILE